MTLSQEILVLDFGDEKQSDFLKSDASIDFNEAGKIAKEDSHLRPGRNVRNCNVTRVPDWTWNFFSRQNSDHRGAVSNENLGAGARGDVCSSGADLYLHDLLLLHEEVADTSQNDALKEKNDSFAERIRKSKWEKR